MTIRVVIADDHRVVRDGLCYLLGQEPNVAVVGVAGDGRQAVAVVAATRPDVLLLDLYMPGLDGHGVLAALHGEPHRPAIVVLTSATSDEHLVRAVRAGATSYLLKTAPAEDVVAAVREAAAGTASLSPELLTRFTQALRRPPPPDPLQPLSPREREVLQLIARGRSNRQIARELEIGEQTVKTHVRSILTKLGLHDRVQAAIFALRRQAGSREHRPLPCGGPGIAGRCLDDRADEPGGPRPAGHPGERRAHPVCEPRAAPPLGMVIREPGAEQRHDAGQALAAAVRGEPTPRIYARLPLERAADAGRSCSPANRLRS